MSDWYVERGDQHRGPFTWEKIKSLADSGRIRRDDLLREGHALPRAAAEFADLCIPASVDASPWPAGQMARTPRAGLREDTFRPRPVPATGPVTIRRFLVGLVAVVTLLTGWVFWSESNLGRDIPPLPMPVAAGSLPSDAECRAFADRIIFATTSGGIPEETLIDLHALGDRSLAGLPVPPKLRDGVIRPGLLKRLREGLGDSFTMRFLRVREVEGEKRVVVRVLTDAGVNYLEFIVEKEPAGHVRAKDLYNYFAGERFSESVRSIAILAIAELNSGALAKLRGTDQAMAANLDKLQAINEASQAGNAAQVLEIYPTLPPDVQKLKVVQLHRCKAATSSLEGKEFSDVMDDVQRHLGDDPRLSLIYIDNYILKKEFGKAYAAMDRLFETTGDPYLHVLRASTLGDEERFDEAVTEARKGTDGDPELLLAWMTRLLAEIKATKFDDAVTTLREADTHFEDFDWTSLWEQPDYAPFTKTPQYEKWADEEL